MSIFNREFLSRRDLVKEFGVASFLLSPIFRSMALAAPSNIDRAPRYVLFFKGGGFIPQRTFPNSIDQLGGTSLASLQNFTKDLIIFKNMHIHGGSPKSTGTHEEHGAGLIGCVTGSTAHYTKGDSYFVYTNDESIDIAIANHYRNRSETSQLPLASLHVGGGAHSDSDGTGQGQRYVSFRKKSSGQSTYGNAIQPMQNVGQVYDMLMTKVSSVCSRQSNQPRTDTTKVDTALKRKQSLVDLAKEGLNEAKRRYGMDAEHSQKLEGLVESWREAEINVNEQKKRAPQATPVASNTGGCPANNRPSGDGSHKQNLDTLSPVHDGMINMVKLAFEWDITRVAAITTSGASSGQVWPSQGVHTARHSLEHAGNVSSLAKLDSYHAAKFANLLKALKSIDDGGGKTALFNSSVFLGSECWSSGGHYLKNVPFILAGQAGGKFKTGRIIDAGGRSVNDIHISCLQAAGAQTNTFGLQSLCRGPIV